MTSAEQGPDASPSGVTVVVVSWDAAVLLDRCLDALETQQDPGVEVTVHVVDNGSSDDTPDVLARRREASKTRPTPQRLCVQRLSSNLGFAGGVAAALERIETPYVVLLNNDAVPEPDFLRRLMAARVGADDTAAWTARVLLRHSDDGVERVNSTGLVVRRDGNGADRGWLEPAREHHPPADVFGFCGAAVLLRTDAVRAAGGFDPGYFLYYEDTDLSWRLRLAGWRIRYVSDAVVHHDHGATSGIGSPLFRFYNERNRLTTLVKNAPLRLALPVLLRHPVTSLARIARGGEARRVGVTRLRAYVAFWRRAPGTWRQRRETPAAMRARRTAVARLLTP